MQDQRSGGRSGKKFIEIGLEIVLSQTMIGTPNKSFRIANHDIQPMEQSGTGIVGLMLVRKAL